VKPGNPYDERERRAAHLIGERPAAAEILTLYLRVLRRQAAVDRWSRSARVLAKARRARDAGNGLALGALPFLKLDRQFRKLVTEVAQAAPPPLAAAAGKLTDASAEQRADLLQTTAALGDLTELTASLETEVEPLLFFARSFLQPLAEALAGTAPDSAPADRAPAEGATESPARSSPATSDQATSNEATSNEATSNEATSDEPWSCPRCGWPPQVAVLRDEPGSPGRRYLVCALCASARPFPRVRCPSCGETDSERLHLHEIESWPHLRIEECGSCRAYLKAVDLRRDGGAVPIVEDLASPELDLWAQERDLWKICRNLVGL